MYELSDQSWRSQPKRMSLDVVDATVDKLYQYWSDEQIGEFEITIHGGEPLLAGKQFVAMFLRRLRTAAVDAKTRLTLTVQTNGLLLDSEWIRLFQKAECLIGVSCDGHRMVHDEHRVDRAGRGTFDSVERAIRLCIAEAGTSFGGVLSLINPRHDGGEIVRFFHALGVPKIDFLLPDQNYVQSSPGYPDARAESRSYSDFLLSAYRAWRQLDDPEFDIRFFRELVHASLGSKPRLDSLGVGDVGIFVIETNGGLEPLDTYKCCGDEFTKMPFNVLTHSIADFALHPPLRSLVERSKQSAPVCQACDVYDMCGGGYMPHRFDGNVFANPSVYCNSLRDICSSIRAEVTAEILAARARTRP